MGIRFKHLNVPDHWEQYWSRYPQGYTILEALISWVSQVDSMVDNQNSLNKNVEDFRKELDAFIKRFDPRLQEEVIKTLKAWQEGGYLDYVIDEALQTQIDNIAVSVLGNGAKGNGSTDDTQAIQNLINTVGDNTTILIPDTGKDYIVTRITIDKKKKITILGGGRLKHKSDVKGGNIFRVTNSEHIIIENLHFNGSNVTPDYGGFDSPVTFVDCVNSGVRGCTVINSPGTSINFMNGCKNCFALDNQITQSRYAAIQVHQGIRDLATGTYIDNKMPESTRVIGNTIDDCGEGLRSAGTINTVFAQNIIRNLKVTGTGYGIIGRPAAHEGSEGGTQLSNGSIGLVIEDNIIETELNSGPSYASYIFVQQMPDVSKNIGSPVTGTVIRGNKIKALTSKTFIKIQGYTYYDNIQIENTIIEMNNLDASALTTPVRAFEVFGYVKALVIRFNQAKGKYTYFATFNAGNGLYETDIRVEGNYIDKTTNYWVQFFSNPSGYYRGIRIMDNSMEDVAMDTDKVMIIYHASDIVIERNTFITKRAGTQSIDLRNTVSQCIVQHNDLSQTGAVTVQTPVDPLIKFFNNKGYVTENKGIYTLKAGTTGIGVPHGLSMSPSAEDIQVVPTSNLGAATKFWIGNFTSTTFSIYVDKDPTQDITFAWRANKYN